MEVESVSMVISFESSPEGKWARELMMAPTRVAVWRVRYDEIWDTCVIHWLMSAYGL